MRDRTGTRNSIKNATESVNKDAELVGKGHSKFTLAAAAHGMNVNTKLCNNSFVDIRAGGKPGAPSSNRVARNLVLRMPRVKRSQQSPGEVEKMTSTLRNSHKKHPMMQLTGVIDHSQHTITSIFSPTHHKKKAW